MKQKSRVFMLVVMSFVIFSVSATQSVNDSISKETVPVQKCFVEDNPILTMLDKLAGSKFFETDDFTTDTSVLNVHNFPPSFVPNYSDSFYSEELKKLDSKSPFDLVYNDDVRSFIELYAVKKRKYTARILGLTELYFPYFEEKLDKFNMPLELKYLAVIESALNPIAVSCAGAAGLWQFMPYTGKLYNLNSTPYTDDRLDPYKSTIAACQFMTDLYKIYNDWILVIAAYNAGPGNVNRAIKKANGEMDFWKIKKYLPKETNGYVPAFIAVNYVMTHAAEHNIYPIAPHFKHYEVDTVTAKQNISFQQITEFLKTPYEDIVFLNPTYKKGFVPSNQQEQYVLTLPKNYIGDFINNETALYEYQTQEQIAREEYAKMHIKQTYGNTFDKHVVKRGESLGAIANKYNCSVNDLTKWNNLRNTVIYPNQKLLVQMPAPAKKVIQQEAPASIKPENSTAETKETEKPVTYIYHIIQVGDTLTNIVKMYDGLSIEQLKQLNNLKEDDQLKPGQKIKVGVTSS